MEQSLNLPLLKVFDHRKQKCYYSYWILFEKWQTAEWCYMRSRHWMMSLAFPSPTKWGQNILSYLPQQMMKPFSFDLSRCCWESLRVLGKQKTRVNYENSGHDNIFCHCRSCPKKIKRATNSLPHLILLWEMCLDSDCDCWYRGSQQYIFFIQLFRLNRGDTFEQMLPKNPCLKCEIMFVLYNK